MKHDSKKNKQPVKELKRLRKRIAELEASETERKRAEFEELKHVHQVYREVIENAQGIPYRFNYDDSTFEFFGKDCEELIGIHSNEVTKLTYQKFREIVKNRIILDPEAPSDPFEYSKAFLRGEVKRYRADFKIVTPRGEEKWISDCSLPILDKKTGKVIASLGILQDITERKRAEEELQKHREHLQELVGERTAELAQANRVARSINEVFQQALPCETEEDLAKTCLTLAEKLTGSKFGFIGELNQAGTYDTIAISNPGWDVCKMPKSTATKLLMNMPLRGIWARPLKEGKSLILTDPSSHPDSVGSPEGHPPIASFLGVPLKHEGRTFGMFALGNKEGGYDIADQEAAERLSVAIVEALRSKRAELSLRNARAELIRKERLAVLGQLAGGVGHELRNPMGVISNAVYYLQTILPDADETTKEYLHLISSEVRNADKIVSDLLNLSRTKAVEREEIAVAELVAQALEKQPPPEGVKATTELASELPPLFVDRAQISQVLGNMITNAYQAMPEGGKLAISAQADKEQVLLSITDTGSGISKENMNKLFEPLFTTRARGIGLGLPVAQNLVEVNAGRIEVESEEGKGSTFTVILPTKGD